MVEDSSVGHRLLIHPKVFVVDTGDLVDIVIPRRLVNRPRVNGCDPSRMSDRWYSRVNEMLQVAQLNAMMDRDSGVLTP